PRRGRRAAGAAVAPGRGAAVPEARRRPRAAAHRNRVPAVAILHATPRHRAVEIPARRARLRIRRGARQQRDRSVRAPAAHASRCAPDRDATRPGIRVSQRRMSSLRRRLAVALSLVLLAVAALLALGLQHYPRELVESYVVSRLEHDAETLYVRLAEAADPAAVVPGALGPIYALPLSGHYFVARRTAHRPSDADSASTIVSRSLWDEELPVADLADAVERVVRRPGPAGQTL